MQATSALTHNISGTAKACVQTVLALLYFQNPTTPKNLIGIALVLLGSMFYTMVRNAEMEAEKQAKLHAVSAKAAPPKYEEVENLIPSEKRSSPLSQRMVRSPAP